MTPRQATRFHPDRIDGGAGDHRLYQRRREPEHQAGSVEAAAPGWRKRLVQLLRNWPRPKPALTDGPITWRWDAKGFGFSLSRRSRHGAGSLQGRPAIAYSVVGRARRWRFAWNLEQRVVRFNAEWQFGEPLQIRLSDGLNSLTVQRSAAGRVHLANARQTGFHLAGSDGGDPADGGGQPDRLARAGQRDPVPTAIADQYRTDRGLVAAYRTHLERDVALRASIELSEPVETTAFDGLALDRPARPHRAAAGLEGAGGFAWM